MTLVVAKILGDRIFIESDSRIMDRTKVQSDPLCGVLKAVLVSPTVCVCFAGNVHFAELALKAVIEGEVTDPVEIQAVLVSSVTESGGSVEYLLAFLDADTPKLIKVSDGVDPVETNAAWIGNHRAFEVFQEAMLTRNDSADPNSLGKAFNEVMNDQTIDDVGDFQISLYISDSINPSARVFMYAEKMEAFAPEAQHIPKGEAVPLSFGTAAGGAYGITYLVSLSKVRFGVAVFFHLGGFGVLYSPQVSFEGVVLRASDGQAFAQRVLDEYLIPLYGFYQAGRSIHIIDTRPGHR